MVDDEYPSAPQGDLGHWRRALADAAAILDRIPLSIVATDARGRILVANEAAQQLVGCNESELLGAPLGRIDAATAADAGAVLASRVGPERPATYLHMDGRSIAVQQLTVPLAGSGEQPVAFLSIARSVDAAPPGQGAQPDEVDRVTGLPTRVAAVRRLRAAIASARREGTEVVVLVLRIDHLDEFRAVLGRQVRDELLSRTASRIRTWVRSSDLVARVDDGFLIVLTQLRRARPISSRVEALLEDLLTTVVVDRRALPLTVSVGGAVHPADGADPELLIAAATVAMTQAAAQGGNSFVWLHELGQDE